MFPGTNRPANFVIGVSESGWRRAYNVENLHACVKYELGKCFKKALHAAVEIEEKGEGVETLVRTTLNKCYKTAIHTNRFLAWRGRSDRAKARLWACLVLDIQANRIKHRILQDVIKCLWVHKTRWKCLRWEPEEFLPGIYFETPPPSDTEDGTKEKAKDVSSYMPGPRTVGVNTTDAGRTASERGTATSSTNAQGSEESITEV